MRGTVKRMGLRLRAKQFFSMSHVSPQPSPHLCIFKMLRVKRGILRCFQTLDTFLTPTPANPLSPGFGV